MLKVGFCVKDITPPLGGDMVGYFQRRISTAVKTRLYAKAAVVEVGGEYAAFLVTDTLLVPEGICEEVKEKVYNACGIEGERIFIGATHSHTSVTVRYSDGEEDNRELNKSILDSLKARAAEAVIGAYESLTEAELFFGKSNVKGVSFVRQYLTDDGEVRTNPYYCRERIIRSIGEPDTELPVAFFRDKNGKPLGSITSLSLHHDTADFDRTLLSSDYSGLVADNLKKEYGEDFVSIFFAGFCGDINHLNYLPNERLLTPQTEIGEKVTEAYSEAVASLERVEVESLSVSVEKITVKKREFDKELLKRIEYLTENPPEGEEPHISKPYGDAMLYAARDRLLNWYVRNERELYETQSMAVRIGDVLISGVSGEMFSDYVYKIREASPTDKNICVAYSQSSEVTCYMPPLDKQLPFIYESTYYSQRFALGTGEAETEAAIRAGKNCFK